MEKSRIFRNLAINDVDNTIAYKNFSNNNNFKNKKTYQHTNNKKYKYTYNKKQHINISINNLKKYYDEELDITHISFRVAEYVFL